MLDVTAPTNNSLAIHLGGMTQASAANRPDYASMSHDRLKAVGSLLGIQGARRFGVPRLLKEIAAAEAVRLQRHDMDLKAVQQWACDVSDLFHLKPWEMTKDQWSRARSLCASGCSKGGPYDISGITLAMDAFYTRFGYSSTGAHAARWSPSNARHEVHVMGALENGVTLSPEVLADYAGPDAASRSFRFESSAAVAFADLLDKALGRI